ncbi:toll/interleukin-1 receptor domain-containing protein [Actinomadura oligospora]|uniref:toll/interleukin-1 receptor domain-containing protein n=1 Tax=Actinomadura oligospora TaxID=111804 RepID=UPI00047B6656|nr:toll/interleukin-1 receptor domain-containing protein [Actinomadura oligospora]
MVPPSGDRRSVPQVFLCYADANQRTAERLYEHLRREGIQVFRPNHDLLPGDQIVSTVEARIVASDYFLLVWSRACPGESWVQDLWSAGLMINERRGFLVVLRVDDSPVPKLLTARRRLDAFTGWDTAVAELVGAWSRDRGLRLPVLPVPAPDGSWPHAACTIYIRNRAFDVSHVIAIPDAVTGTALYGQVHAELALPDEISELDGRIGLRFTYALLKDERPLPSGPLDEHGIGEGAIVDLEVRARPFGPSDGGPTDGDPLGPYRTDPDPCDPGMGPATAQKLLERAFRHLFP